MPCIDGRDSSPVNFSPPESLEMLGLTAENKKLTAENNKLTAMLCALLTELDERDLTEEVLMSAECNGEVDINTFWEEHKKEDETRIKGILDSLSAHEQSLLKKLMEDGAK